mmetsp:Transcript_33972/g.67648  ORF Transcript_33972/g.67648 Transcript_33972/m.67648 type:complete len:302 (-) Transcript_33972:233-1138(-)
MNQCGMQMGGLKDNNSDPNRVLRVPVGKFTEWFFSIGPQRGMCRSVQAFRNNACAMANLEQLASCGEGAQSTPGATARREIPPREPDFEIRVEWARDDGPWKSATINVAVSREDTLDEVFVRYQHALAAKLGPRDEGLLYMPQDQPKWVVIKLGDEYYGLSSLDNRVSEVYVGGVFTADGADGIFFNAGGVDVRTVGYRKDVTIERRDAKAAPPERLKAAVDAWDAWAKAHEDELAAPAVAKRVFLQTMSSLTGRKKRFNVFNVKPEELIGVREVDADAEHFRFRMGGVTLYCENGGVEVR